MRIYTKAGDDGTTGLFLGGRVRKSDALMEACGDLDEAVAVLGLARSQAPSPLDESLLARQRELFVVAADLATNPDHRDRLVPGVSLVTDEMVTELEHLIDQAVARRPLRPVFVVPGATPLSAALDHARTVIRRAERHSVATAELHPVSPDVLRYLNRLSDLVFVLAREAAGDAEEPPSHE
ncbi:cob(I)yrinic acid a,c-diamide adenosyltransferase [Cellulomonas bogoriensis]|uniref:Corrinoid adenosyltransferase n=1 Tax=Cellulomonas bogoriensis 69B4 = DSM 16987 TaxID=1386082 RepID=A0A0A0BZN3_9CELL|nr:cob(I)yrinic acid a,c-diamide adenosyltransferase [Cellulomonas bogoriensis]KGM13391.1 cob(I)yrinic acid a c-diamide adenosyltransferase [Cellulomonas bogoriensis 69B4 = DSM 16987]